MARNDKIEMEGTVIRLIPGAKFLVEIELENGQKMEVTCAVSGKLRQNYIRIIVGDRVTLEISPYDLSRGIITWRNK